MGKRLGESAGWRALAALYLALVVGCASPSATPLSFSKEQAIARAERDAAQSAPGMDIQQTRVDSVSTELITLGEADTRMGGGRGPGGYGPGQTAQSPVWWVVVRGYFRYQGTGAPPNPAPVYEADERDFIYDARTGESIGGRMPNTRVVPTPTPIVLAPSTLVATPSAMAVYPLKSGNSWTYMVGRYDGFNPSMIATSAYVFTDTVVSVASVSSHV